MFANTKRQWVGAMILKSKRFYNKLIKINKNIKHEKLYRNDYKYDFIIPINYNTKKTKVRKR